MSLNDRSFLRNVANTKLPRIIEHIIELQLSSHRAFGLAKEILISFMQDKNRARPSDWDCPSRGFLYFQRGIACFECSLPILSPLQKMKPKAFIRNNINNKIITLIELWLRMNHLIQAQIIIIIIIRIRIHVNSTEIEIYLI